MMEPPASLEHIPGTYVHSLPFEMEKLVDDNISLPQYMLDRLHTGGK